MTTPAFTPSLKLEPLLPRHRGLLLTMFEDQRVWTYLDGSPADAEKTTTRFIDAAELSRSATGLGIWTAFLRADSAEGRLPSGTFVGIGGVRTLSADLWNLGLSIAPTAWGRGYATELATAAVNAAQVSFPNRTVTARTLTKNAGSERALISAGLRVVWRGPSAAHPGEEARILTDRQPRRSELESLIHAS
ncbi:GNAT family N-acetyltransferase [Streptomyces sp. NPDC048385]|uniref:GNAT family N-acetyltransferase n=1 Tax=unclassified Streptomyces TaxID=2593676 RepID=UPI00341DF3CE